MLKTNINQQGPWKSAKPITDELPRAIVTFSVLSDICLLTLAWQVFSKITSSRWKAKITRKNKPEWAAYKGAYVHTSVTNERVKNTLEKQSLNWHEGFQMILNVEIDFLVKQRARVKMNLNKWAKVCLILNWIIICIDCTSWYSVVNMFHWFS